MNSFVDVFVTTIPFNNKKLQSSEWMSKRLSIHQDSSDNLYLCLSPTIIDATQERKTIRISPTNIKSNETINYNLISFLRDCRQLRELDLISLEKILNLNSILPPNCQSVLTINVKSGFFSKLIKLSIAFTNPSVAKEWRLKIDDGLRSRWSVSSSLRRKPPPSTLLASSPTNAQHSSQSQANLSNDQREKMLSTHLHASLDAIHHLQQQQQHHHSDQLEDHYASIPHNSISSEVRRGAGPQVPLPPPCALPREFINVPIISSKIITVHISLNASEFATERQLNDPVYILKITNPFGFQLLQRSTEKCCLEILSTSIQRYAFQNPYVFIEFYSSSSSSTFIDDTNLRQLIFTVEYFATFKKAFEEMLSFAENAYREKKRKAPTITKNDFENHEDTTDAVYAVVKPTKNSKKSPNDDDGLLASGASSHSSVQLLEQATDESCDYDVIGYRVVQEVNQSDNEIDDPYNDEEVESFQNERLNEENDEEVDPYSELPEVGSRETIEEEEEPLPPQSSHYSNITELRSFRAPPTPDRPISYTAAFGGENAF